VVEDRHAFCSTIVATQLPIENWHENIRDPTIADAILDRLIHNAHKINLKGESMRKLLGRGKMILKQQIEAAKQSNLPGVLQSFGIEIVLSGANFQSKNHDSLKFFSPKRRLVI